MSRFYGTLHGLEDSPRTGIPRYGLGSESGLEVNLRSSEGSVSIRVYEGEAADGGLEDRVRITFERVMSWPPEVPPQFVGKEFELYSGPLSECRFDCIRTNTQEVES